MRGGDRRSSEDGGAPAAPAKNTICM